MSKQLTTTSEIIEWINTRTEQLTNKLCNIQERIDEKDDIGENTGELWQDYDKTDAQSAILIELLNKIAPDQKSATKCPRCGEHTLKMPLSTNALSRHIPGAYVCDSCGTNEAIEDFNNANVDDIDEAISRLKEEMRACEFQEDAIPETQAPETINEQHHNKRMAYIINYIQDEIEFYQDDDNTNRGISDDELNNQINTTYACINAICDAGMVFGGITSAEAAACRTLFYNAFPDKIKI